MHATILLADNAQGDSTGKVHALGLGWNVIRAPLGPHAVVMMLVVPWNDTNVPHKFDLRLLNDDGEPPMVGVDQSGGYVPLHISGEFEVGRPAGVPPGTDLTHTHAFNLPPLPLQPGRYEWWLEIDGHHDETWSARFLVAKESRSR